MKDLVIGKDASRKATDALSRVANAVGSTLGPAGAPAIIDRYEPALKITRPVSTKDGITVLDHLMFEDSVEHAIHGLSQACSLHCVTAAGDGTTSTIVLASELANAICNQESKTPQAYSRLVNKVINECIDKVDELLLENDNDTDYEYCVAKTSANGDDEVASIASNVVKQTSKYSNVIIEKDPSSKERYQVTNTNGYVCGNGYRRFRQLMTTISHRANDTLFPIELSNIGVVCLNGNITSEEQVLNIIESIYSEDSPANHYEYILFLAFSIDDTVATKLVLHNRKMTDKGKILFSEVSSNSAVEGAGYQCLIDSSAFTGAVIYDPITEFNPEYVGDCNSIVFHGFKTTLKGRGSKNWVKKRCKENAELVNHAKNQYQRDLINARNAELADGLTTIIVGAGQHAEIQERADRLDDAVRASQSVRNGVVAGGGLIYARIAELVETTPQNIKEALKAVTNRILENYGEEFDVYTPKEFKDKEYCLNILESGISYQKAKDAGVVDSATAVKAVLKQAFILASLTATTRCLSLDNKQKERNSLNLVKNSMGE